MDCCLDEVRQVVGQELHSVQPPLALLAQHLGQMATVASALKLLVALPAVLPFLHQLLQLHQLLVSLQQLS
jgi:hypothetical protein